MITLEEIEQEILKRCEEHGIKMTFGNAPVGARFKFPSSNDVWIKIHSNGDGLIVKWNGNIQGFQTHCSWVDEENGYNFDTGIELC